MPARRTWKWTKRRGLPTQMLGSAARSMTLARNAGIRRVGTILPSTDKRKCSAASGQSDIDTRSAETVDDFRISSGIGAVDSTSVTEKRLSFRHSDNVGCSSRLRKAVLGSSDTSAMVGARAPTPLGDYC